MRLSILTNDNEPQQFIDLLRNTAPNSRPWGSNNYLFKRLIVEDLELGNIYVTAAKRNSDDSVIITLEHKPRRSNMIQIKCI